MSPTLVEYRNHSAYNAQPFERSDVYFFVKDVPDAGGVRDTFTFDSLPHVPWSNAASCAYNCARLSVQHSSRPTVNANGTTNISVSKLPPRFLLGLSNGTIVAAKTLVSEVCPKEHQAVGMGFVMGELPCPHRLLID